MTAKDFFVAQQNLAKPETTKKQWGGTIGGPIVRDKMHFFASFERQDRAEGRSRVYPTRPDRSFTVAQKTDSWNYMGRVDHQLNASHNYNVRFLWDHQPNYNQVLGNGTIDTLSIEKDNDWSFVAAYNWVAGGTKLNTLRASAVHEKPKRGQPLYQETGDWTLAPPTLQLPELHRPGRHQLRGLPEHERLRRRRHVQLVHRRRRRQPRSEVRRAVPARRALPRGPALHERRVQFTTDRVFNAADPSTYPERLTIRVPQMVQLLSRTHSLGHVRAGQVADDPASHAEPGPALRRPRLAAHASCGIRSSPIPNAYPVDKNNFQPRVGFAYSPSPASVIRGGYGVFYEKQWIDRFENYSLNRVFTNSFQAQFPTAQADPGPGQRTVPDRSAARQRADAESDARQPARAAGHAGPEHRRGLARHAGSDPAAAASGVDRLRAPDRPPAVVRGRLHAHPEPESCRCATT